VQEDDRRTFQSLRSAQVFLQEHGNVVSTAEQPLMVQHLDNIIGTAYTHITTRAVTELRACSLVATEKVLLKNLRRDHLKLIVAIAKADLPHTPEFKVLRMPKARPRLDELIAAARAMGGLAERFADIFVAMGTPPGFVDALHDAANAVLRTRDTRKATLAQKHHAVVGLAATIAEGRKVLADIDGWMSTQLHRDVALLANWRAVTATPPKLGRPRKPRARPNRPSDDEDPPKDLYPEGPPSS
jgi:hypothetical protein